MKDLTTEDIKAVATSSKDVVTKRIWLVVAISLIVVIADQIFKIWVKTNFYLGESLSITSWWELKFIENNGMAFGLELWNKMVLTLGRIFAVGLFIWFVAKIRMAGNLRNGFLWPWP